MRKAIKILSILVALTIGIQLAGNTAKKPINDMELYQDNQESGLSTEQENFIKNDMRFNKKNKSYDKDSEQTEEQIFYTTTEGDGRNTYIRESSHKKYSNGDKPAWEVNQLYYDTPSLDSIIAKYKKSDFAGCMQECESYVNIHPEDTLGYYYLAMSYTKVRDLNNAVKAYEKVISLNDNPMIVKYATNGRNCIINKGERCYVDVNVPEYLYPYKDIAGTVDLTPVDTQTLIDRNLKALKEQMVADKKENESTDKKNIPLPQFGIIQDEELDKFIDAPYGTGLEPKLEKEYTLQRLKIIQESINNKDESVEDEVNDINNIRKFDNEKSDSGEIKLAYNNEDLEALSKDPQYIQAQKEMNELRLLLGNDKSNISDDFTDLIPYMSEHSRNLSPEVIQAMLLRGNSNITDFNFTNEQSF